ncbi:hypothetical protein FB446DRAFT_710226, partial [Lentinula raphanica]
MELPILAVNILVEQQKNAGVVEMKEIHHSNLPIHHPSFSVQQNPLLVPANKPPHSARLDSTSTSDSDSNTPANKPLHSVRNPRSRMVILSDSEDASEDNSKDGSEDDLPSPPKHPESKTPTELHNAQSQVQLMSPSKLNAVSTRTEYWPAHLSTLMELPSPKWNQNSCWLDSSMEVLFCAMAFYNAFDEFESLVLEEKSLKKYLGSSHGEATEISNIRDQLRKTLYTIKAVQGQIDNFQTAFGWFLSLITGISGLPCNTKCISYFGTTTLELWKCTHAPSGMEHCRLKIQKRPVGWAPVPHQWDEYQGSIQSWFSSISNFRAKLR